MSSINVTNIKSRQGGAPTFPQGLNVSAGVATFAGNVSIAGTLTYDDVTNIDSVGIITAGKGFRSTTGGLIVSAGVATFAAAVDVNSSADVSGGVNLSAGNLKVTAGIATVGAGLTLSSDFIHLTDNSKIQLGIASDLALYHNGSHSVIQNATGSLLVEADSCVLRSQAQENYLVGTANGSVDLYYDNTKKIETISTGASVYGGLRLEGGGLMREHVNISGTALNSDKVINLSQGMIHYRSAAVGGANVKLNVISTAGINTDMAIGDAMTVTVITVAGSSSHFVDQIRIDGVEASAGVTTHWVGGSAPTDGGASGVDTYAFNIIKTGNAAYLAVANQVGTS